MHSGQVLKLYVQRSFSLWSHKLSGKARKHVFCQNMNLQRTWNHDGCKSSLMILTSTQANAICRDYSRQNICFEILCMPQKFHGIALNASQICSCKPKLKAVTSQKETSPLFQYIFLFLGGDSKMPVLQFCVTKIPLYSAPALLDGKKAARRHIVPSQVKTSSDITL